MAIYHCSVRTFSRSEGHSAVAAAAYRSGSLLRDERTSRIHRYENRTGVKSAFILAPNGVPETILSRAELWNAAEASENRKNSRVAREVILALPHELDDKARSELSRDMGLYLIERYRVAVDVAIHAPCDGDGHDPRNHHAHLLFTTREIGKDGFGAKTRVLDDKITGPEEIEIIREVWETLANDALERAGCEARIDRRSLEEQGIDRIPQIHEGKNARNAKASLMMNAFAQASDGEDDEGDTDGDGEKGKSKSGSSSQGQNFSANNGQSADASKNLDRSHPRLTLNDEIKALNDRRSEFSTKPLPQQIAQLDRMMERLDKRLERLEKLERKTTPRKIVKHLIETAIRAALHFLVDRRKTASQIERQSSKAAVTKHRYGRRKHLINKMKEIRQNIDIVEKKKDGFRQFKGLINRIELELKRHQQAEAKSTTAGDKRPILQPRTTENINPNRITYYKVMAMRNVMQERMTRTLTPLRPMQTLKASTAMHGVLKATAEKAVPPNKSHFNAKAKAEMRPVQIIKTGIEFKLPDKPVRTTSTPPSSVQFNTQINKKPTKPIIKIKTDLDLKIPETDPPQVKMSFNTTSGSTPVKPVTNLQPRKRTLH